MSRLSHAAIHDLIHQALVARVRVLLGQIGYEELMDVQLRVAQKLAAGAWPWHGADLEAGVQSLAQAVLDAFGLDGEYYGGRSLDFIVSEGLAAAGVQLGEVIRGHEQDSRSTWQAQVVPELDRIQARVVSVFKGQ